MNARKNKQRIYSRMGQPGGIVWYNTIVNNAFAFTPGRAGAAGTNAG